MILDYGPECCDSFQQSRGEITGAGEKRKPQELHHPHVLSLMSLPDVTCCMDQSHCGCRWSHGLFSSFSLSDTDLCAHIRRSFTVLSHAECSCTRSLSWVCIFKLLWVAYRAHITVSTCSTEAYGDIIIGNCGMSCLPLLACPGVCDLRQAAVLAVVEPPNYKQYNVYNLMSNRSLPWTMVSKNGSSGNNQPSTSDQDWRATRVSENKLYSTPLNERCCVCCLEY